MALRYQKYFRSNFHKIILTVLLFLPGFFLDQYVVVFWYLLAFSGAIIKKTEYIFTLFVLWTFSVNGAYHYHLLGPDQSPVLVKYFDEFLIVLMVLLYIVLPKEKNIILERYLKFGIYIVFIALFSGILNGVGLVSLLNYFTSSFRWLIIFFVLSRVKFSEQFFGDQIALIFVIIMANSIFGFLQTIVLPFQTTPDGYTPDYLDVASGFFGVTAGPFLTTLCLGIAFYFIFFTLVKKINTYIIFIGILFLQPFFSSSKAVLAFMVFIFIYSLVLLILKFKLIRIRFQAVIQFLALIVVVGTGYTFYQQINEVYFGSLTENIASYFEKKQAITDFNKIRGYIEAFGDVAPRGAAGIWLGVGPTNFTSNVGLKNRASLISSLKLDVESSTVSSADFRTTDMTGIIGELGLAGAAAYLIFMFFLYFSTLKRVNKQTSTESKLFTFFTAQWIGIVILFTMYDKGWFLPFYYIPLIVFLVSDTKSNKADFYTGEVDKTA